MYKYLLLSLFVTAFVTGCGDGTMPSLVNQDENAPLENVVKPTNNFVITNPDLVKPISPTLLDIIHKCPTAFSCNKNLETLFELNRRGLLNPDITPDAATAPNNLSNNLEETQLDAAKVKESAAATAGGSLTVNTMMMF